MLIPICITAAVSLVAGVVLGKEVTAALVKRELSALGDAATAEVKALLADVSAKL